MIAVRSPQELEEQLARLAKETDRTKTFYVREAIAEHIAELEDKYLAERVLERAGAGKEDTVQLDDMIARRVLRFLKERVAADRRSLGEPLKGELSESWRYWVGD
jgi:RHH-type rel operon transcriptional repressor/antitoxin RelB